MWEPVTMSPNSIMPRYPWLFSTTDHDASLNTSLTKKKLEAMKTLGVPYEDDYIEQWESHLSVQANAIADDLNKDPNIQVDSNEEIIALIAYLQRLGMDIKQSGTQTASNP